MSSSYAKYLEEYEKVTQELNQPESFNDPEKLKRINKKHRELTEIKEVIEELEKNRAAQKQNKAIIEANEDPEITQMAEEENKNLETQEKKLEKKFDFLTIPRDPDDERDAIIEIRAGAGGDEAGLFAGDLFKMYSAWAEKNNYSLSILDSHKNDLGGLKEMVAQINGPGVYGLLKHESGVHRVQRIPETEKAGRIHTSTATVAVLPVVEEHDLEIKPEEVKVDTYRSSGPGGQSVNTTDSAIRLTHLPTGIVVTCQDEKSQHKNKAKAFSILRARILEEKKREEQQKTAEQRSAQIGTGDRSEKIRTYNFPQDRITDHRLKKSWHGLESILNGNIEPFIDSLKKQELKLRRENLT